MAKRIQTTIFVKNGPSYAGIGIGGEGYCTFTIAGPTGRDSPRPAPSPGVAAASWSAA